jgi:hypothetical protein
MREIIVWFLKGVYDRGGLAIVSNVFESDNMYNTQSQKNYILSSNQFKNSKFRSALPDPAVRGIWLVRGWAVRHGCLPAKARPTSSIPTHAAQTIEGCSPPKPRTLLDGRTIIWKPLSRRPFESRSLAKYYHQRNKIDDVDGLISGVCSLQSRSLYRWVNTKVLLIVDDATEIEWYSAWVYAFPTTPVTMLMLDYDVCLLQDVLAALEELIAGHRKPEVW